MDYGVSHLECPLQPDGQLVFDNIGGSFECIASRTALGAAHGKISDAIEITDIGIGWGARDSEDHDGNGGYAVENGSDRTEHCDLRHLGSQVMLEVFDPVFFSRHTKAGSREIVVLDKRQRKLHQVSAHPDDGGDQLVGNNRSLFDILQIGKLQIPPVPGA